MSKKLTGSCLCGAVKYTTDAEPAVVGHCYCVDCRKSSGTTHCTHAVVPEEALSLTGELNFFDKPADSGNVISRGFCPICGSAIVSRNSDMPGMAFLRASSLEDLDVIMPSMTVYASRAPSWAIFDNANPVFEIMPEDGPQSAIEGEN